MVLYDAGGREIFACPNVDRRAFAEAGDLIREGRAGEDLRRGRGTGCSITSPARVRWLARHRPDILAAAASLGMLSEWIAYRLTGEPRDPNPSSLRVQLGHVLAGQPALVGRHTPGA